MQHRVAFLLNFPAAVWGTRDDMLLALCQALTARGGIPVLVTAAQPPDASRRRYQATGARVETINYEHGLLPYATHLRRLIRRYSIDTVHLRYFVHWTELQWLARVLGVRNIIVTDAESGVQTTVAWRRTLLQLRSRTLTHPTGRMIAISDFVRQRLVGADIREEKIVVIHNGVDAEYYRPNSEMRECWAREFSIVPDEVIVATACALLPSKGVGTLLESVALLIRDGVSARLFVAGNGPLRGQLEEMSRQLGIAGRTHLLGYVNPRPLMQACDIFVLASIGEAFGNVLTEAMACGAPVVATRSGGIPEVVTDGETGLLVPPSNPSAFADAIRTLAGRPDLRQEMGRRGRERVCDQFTLEQFAVKTLRLYESVWEDEVAPLTPSATPLPLA